MSSVNTHERTSREGYTSLDRPGERSGGSNAGLRSLLIVTLLLCGVVLLCTFVFGALMLSRLPARHELSAEQRERFRDSVPLPRAYLVPSDVRTPVKNQAHRGTCYIFSTMGIVEASYRRYGLKKGFLKENEYVKFSEQAYGLGLTRYCAEHKEDPHCLGGPPVNDTADGQPEWLYYMQSYMHQYVMPDSVCPYQPEEEDQYKCPDLDSARSKNPLNFTVGVESAYSIDGIKRLLYQKRFPLTFSHVILESTYTTPCDDKTTPAYDSDQCRECRYPCAQSSDGCCAKVTQSGYTNEGVFTTYSEAVVGGGHAMMVVGWNDDMAVESGIEGQREQRVVGGFILKNSWDTTVGHSAEYWAQKHSLLDETALCPNENSHESWLPVNTSCMVAEVDPIKCCTSKKHVIDHWVFGATVLKCNNATHAKGNQWKYGWTTCDFSKRYLLAGNPDQDYATPAFVVPPNSDGVRRFQLVEYDPSDPTYTPVVVETNATTWYALERLLEPVTVTGNSNHCGYYFMPYDTVLRSNILNPAYGTDTPAFSFLDIKWDDRSFAANEAKNTAYNYSYIKNSTFKYKPPTFNGPLDFNNVQ